MSETSFDCVSCGACCFSRNPYYLALQPGDELRNIPTESLIEADGRQFIRFENGHCVHLKDDGLSGRVCGIYEDRPTACRVFRSGSFECVKARRGNGFLGERIAHEPCAMHIPLFPPETPSYISEELF